MNRVPGDTSRWQRWSRTPGRSSRLRRWGLTVWPLLLGLAAAPALAGTPTGREGGSAGTGEAVLAPPTEELDACRYRLTEVEPGEGEPRQLDPALAGGHGEVITSPGYSTSGTGKGKGKAGKGCYSDVRTFVRAQSGKNCADLVAEIAGWSEKCVKKCNNAARLAEANTSAAATCAAFCHQNGCRTFRYAPRRRCGASLCQAGMSECDPKKCPLFDACYLLQGTQVWNCDCLEL